MLQSISLKIKTKLTYGIGLLFAMIVLLGGLSVKNIYRMSADTQNILAVFPPHVGCARTHQDRPGGTE